MFRRALPLVVVVLASMAGSVLAGDVSGEWVAEFTTPNGRSVENTFNFQVKGEELTGTVSGRRGPSPIEDGKVSEDKISFSVTRDFGRGDFKFLYEGEVKGDEIQLKVTIEGRDRTFEMTAKRVEEPSFR
jgi:hypothetical protein